MYNIYRIYVKNLLHPAVCFIGAASLHKSFVQNYDMTFTHSCQLEQSNPSAEYREPHAKIHGLEHWAQG